MIKKILFVFFLSIAPAAGLAPQSALAQQQDLDPKQFTDAAARILVAAEAGQTGEIWDTASPIMKAATPRAQFAAEIAKRVATNGPYTARQWSSITRNRVGTETGPKVPKGDYLTVGFVGSSRAGKILRGSVSFYLDADKIWRLAGVVM